MFRLLSVSTFMALSGFSFYNMWENYKNLQERKNEEVPQDLIRQIYTIRDQSYLVSKESSQGKFLKNLKNEVTLSPVKRLDGSIQHILPHFVLEKFSDGTFYFSLKPWNPITELSFFYDVIGKDPQGDSKFDGVIVASIYAKGIVRRGVIRLEQVKIFSEDLRQPDFTLLFPEKQRDWKHEYYLSKTEEHLKIDDQQLRKLLISAEMKQ
eukprot:TRINITY_DN1818_c0_g2_i1.p1 TRINITY_DN1818_c0_g2~~TRINITY_DN1818_c0_g2_i1.p1  ORF type:complete len:209 (-),score=36.53 TRINITY_DN1818_c0_g2_i1:133-759(-)